MKINFQYKIAIAVVFLTTQISFAQKQDGDIGTEVVNVVKPYTPTISDAFKVKETPTLEDDETSKKETIQYNIFSFPVASTFTPSKGKAAGVENGAKEKLFSNYATLAAGNYGNINAELFVTQTLENGNYVGAMLRHLSSQGGIKNVVLDDNFSNTGIDVTYGSKSKNLSWNGDIGYQRQTYNWYGLDPILYATLTPTASDLYINSINPKQTYQNIYLGGRLTLGESVFKEATFKFSHFSDAFSSNENRFIAKPSLEFDVMDVKLKTDFILDYINGKFQKDYYDVGGIKYGYTNVGFKPSFQINKDDFSVNVGVGIFYSMATESQTIKKNKLFVYPNITVSYKVVGDLMVAYAGAEGALKQNSFQEFTQENFFVSPTLVIAPTDQRYDIYVGLKGKLANTIGYNIRGSYMNEGSKSLFLRNGFSYYNTNKEGYANGNSFDVVYDDVKTISFYGELKADFSKNVSFGINGTFSSYSTNNQAEAWNLPALKINSNVDFNITSKWYAGLNVFFVGERKDIKFVQTALAIFPPTFTTETTTLDSYFDLNSHVGYKYNERLTFFLKGNNLANQSYQRWISYPVQGIQGLIGANYKFDF
ncbi:TonB-dependent receptor [Flavobacterium sp. SUN052]|uniref:TonB-dependent receptor n=1 Tax=Flavobacterium sp. SUN052 TaxID=3002441 RepID=UPI00237E9671|nr:TonB-dependent receptor [Flavobacterium sp. SUN052]MEC4005416.1 TonB-dependent receptor [Flavobacterium sp. SUN052]